jgi:tagatose 1,6-diphosphate aldolase
MIMVMPNPYRINEPVPPHTRSQITETNWQHMPDGNLIDEDLRLVLVKQGMASEPDSTITVYKYKMKNVHSGAEMGEINLRAGYTENIKLYRGNIGFAVFEPFRGHHLSGRSCLLLKPFIRSLGLEIIWLTCNIDNVASQKNLALTGARYLDTIRVPDDSPYAPFYPPYACIKLRYRWDVGEQTFSG